MAILKRGGVKVKEKSELEFVNVHVTHVNATPYSRKMDRLQRVQSKDEKCMQKIPYVWSDPAKTLRENDLAWG